MMQGVMQVFLETERLILRRFTQADLDNLVELDSDPDVMHFLTGGKPTSREAIQNEILPGLLRDYGRRAASGRWAAIEKTTAEFLGWFSLRQRANSSADEVELGYRLRRSAWGQGYATEGSRALVRMAFAELGIQRVFAESMAVNTASRRVMEKAGLKLVRTFHLTWDDPIDGTEHGEVEYELHKVDWEQQQAP